MPGSYRKGECNYLGEAALGEVRREKSGSHSNSNKSGHRWAMGRRGCGMNGLWNGNKTNSSNMDANGNGRRGCSKDGLWNGKKTMRIRMEMDVAGGTAARTGSGIKKDK